MQNYPVLRYQPLCFDKGGEGERNWAFFRNKIAFRVISYSKLFLLSSGYLLAPHFFEAFSYAELFGVIAQPLPIRNAVV